MSLIKPKPGATAARSPAGRGGASKPRFEYKARSPEQVRAQASRAVGGRDSFFSEDIQFFTPRVGENNVRILPPPPDADWGHYGLNVAVHYGIGADESAYLCPKKMKDEPCPLCEERDRATNAGEDDLADALKPSYRVAVFVIDRAQEAKGPLLWNIAGGLDKDITKLCIDPKSGSVLAVDDPNDGYDLSFSREGEGMKTKYKGIQFSRQSSPLADDPDVGEKWLAYVLDHNIESCLKFFDADYISKVFEGQAPPETKEEKAAGGRDSKGGDAGRRRVAPRGEAAAPAAAPKPRIQPRGAAAKAPEPEPEPAGDEQPPTWEELEQLDEDGCAAVIDAFQLDPGTTEFDSIDALRDWIAEQLQIEKPAPAPAAAGGSWKDRLKKKIGK
jgi:hypothetical protein